MKNGLVINEVGEHVWYLKDKIHRTDGPAIETNHGDKYWFFEGHLHRFNGPAIEWANGDKDWYLFDVRYRNLNEWLKYHPTMSKDEKILFKLTWNDRSYITLL